MTRFVSLGRLVLGPPVAAMSEPTGDPVGAIGGATVPAPRVPYQVGVDVNTILSGASTNTDAARIRRQLRALLNNTPLKMQMHIYFVYSDDTEQDGWYIPGPMALSSPDSTAWKAVGLWQTSSGQWNLAGRMRTMREGRSLMIKDLRFDQYERDYLGWIILNDFSALSTLALTVLPNGASRPTDTVTDQQVVTNLMTAGRDGGQCLIALNLADLACIAYERPESALNLSDVIAYDRRGQITNPTAGPDTLWEEAYGPDYPWSWLGSTPDAPVLDNGRVRVRYDQSAGNPGFCVEMWDAVNGYVEQGKMTLYRQGDANEYVDSWSSAGLAGYTPDLAVAQVVLINSGDVTSYQRVYITVGRGIQGVRFEVYASPKVNGSQSDVVWIWTPAVTDVQDSMFKSATQVYPPPIGTGVGVWTAGSGSALWPPTNFGTSGLSENFVSLLRCSAVATVTKWQANLSIVQGGVIPVAQGDTTGYGVTRNTLAMFSSGGAGYCSVYVNFCATSSDQVLECESFRNAGSGTTSTINDALASNGQAVAETQQFSTDAATCLKTSNLSIGTFHGFLRAATTGGGLCEAQLVIGGVGAGVASVGGLGSTPYTWYDLGEVVSPTDSPTLELVVGYQSTGNTINCDRLELFKVSTGPSGQINGARDAAQSCLVDSRTFGTLTAR